MFGKERFRDYLAYRLISLSKATFKARILDKLPFYKEAAFCEGVSCYISSTKEMKRSNQVFEKQIYDWLASFQAGDVFYDVGANVGMFSLTVAKIHVGTVKTYSFEPSFSTFTSLVNNVVFNKFEDVIFPYPLILGREKGVRRFNYSSTASGAAIHSLDDTRVQSDFSISSVYSQSMIGYSLDDLVADYGFPYPTHIKIDVDGAEKEVLEGMQLALLNPNIKSVLVEIVEHGNDDVNAIAVKEILKNAGFEVSFQHVHKVTKSSALVSDYLYVKNWKFPH